MNQQRTPHGRTVVSYTTILTRVLRQQWIPLLLTVGSLIGAIAGLLGTISKTKDTIRIPQERLASSFAERLQELDSIKNQLAEVQKQLGGLTKVPEDAQVAGTLAKISEDVQQHTARLKALDEAIQASPEKALSLPLLRKDLEIEHAATSLELVAVRAEIARIYDFNKWFFGLIATMAVSMLGFAFSQVFKRKKDEET